MQISSFLYVQKDFLAEVNALLAALLESIRISACIYKVVSSYIHLVHAVQTIIRACSI